MGCVARWLGATEGLAGERAFGCNNRYPYSADDNDRWRYLKRYSLALHGRFSADDWRPAQSAKSYALKFNLVSLD